LPYPLRPTRARTALLLTVLLALCLALAACGSDDDASSDSASTGTGGASSAAFPVTVTGGAFGDTTVEKAPKRVVTLGWSDQDVVVALGVKPVGVFDIGPDFPQGIGPWGKEQLGGAKPELLSMADGVPFEKIAALRPDLIVAVQSGVTQADYDKLSQVAPTVTYAKGRGAYVSPWEEQTAIIGKALGQEAKARELVASTKARIAQARTDHPDLQGKTFSYMARQDADQVGLYLPNDLRVKFLTDLGMKLSPGQVAATKDVKDNFFVDVSYERLGTLDADALVAWFNTPKDRETFTGRSVFQGLPVVKRGGFVPLDLVQAQAQGAPTVLSIPWAIDNVVPLIEQGLKGKGPKE
jgi:iron complex transport system substrate-binding protein